MSASFVDSLPFSFGDRLSSAWFWEQALFTLAGFLTLAFLVDYARMLQQRSKLPPGPFPLPIVGNVLQLPNAKPWYKFDEWSKKYNNPLITVWFGRRPSVILNDAWTASDLFEKRANIYSSRPTFEVAGRVMGYETCNQTMLRYNDQWRMHRKLLVSRYHPPILIAALQRRFSSG
jgi:hypothetical protein